MFSCHPRRICLTDEMIKLREQYTQHMPCFFFSFAQREILTQVMHILDFSLSFAKPCFKHVFVFQN